MVVVYFTKYYVKTTTNKGRVDVHITKIKLLTVSVIKPNAQKCAF